MLPLLTVFTPSYNRAHLLPRLYAALLRQTSQDFCWLIIDDGSADNTRELVAGWIAKGKISIRYHYKENGGMHTAHNAAYELIETELNTCVDSDDWMPDEAVEKIVTFWRQHGSDKYAGMMALDATVANHSPARQQGDSTQDNASETPTLIDSPTPHNIPSITVGAGISPDTNHLTVIGSELPCDRTEIKLGEFYANGGTGDKKLIYRTEVMRRYPPYPTFPGEKYVSLAYKYQLADQDYPLLILNEVVCIVEYQTEGSSFNMFHQYRRNPRGFAFMRKQDMIYGHTFKQRLKAATHYIAKSLMLRNLRFLQESPRKLLTLTAIPAGVVLYFYIMQTKANSPFKGS